MGASGRRMGLFDRLAMCWLGLSERQLHMLEVPGPKVGLRAARGDASPGSAWVASHLRA